MPEPLRPSQRYMPGLDGLRALAVLAVIAYHLEFGWAQGGLLGVGIFFTLSGYLITDMLLAQVDRGGVRLAAFWLGRARRLLPALFLMLAVVVTWVTVVGPAQPPQFREAVGAAALYVSNWQLILQHVSYFARFGPASPLNHLWSLGVEEQFYIVWPLLLPLGVRLIRERPTAAGLRPRLAVATLILAAASAVEMWLLYRPSFDPSRIYFGTDTRAFEILAGAALAMVWPSARLRGDISRGARRTLDCLGAIGLLAICVLIVQTSQYSAFLYRGGFVLLALATVLLLAALVHPAARLGAVLGVAPLRWIGVRSYGIYLWSVPIIVLTTPAFEPRHRPAARRPAGGRDRVRRRAVVALCRAADPPRRARAPVAPPALGGLAPARPAPRGLGGARGRARPARAHLRRAGRRQHRLGPRSRRRRRRAAHRERSDGDRDEVLRRRRRRRDRRTFAAHLLPVGDPHRRLHLGGSGLLRLPARSRAAHRSPVRARRRHPAAL